MLLDLQTLPKPLNPIEIFGREGPLEIEIGVGKGRFLQERALAFPHHNFLGIEKSKKWLLKAQEKFKKSQLTNIRLVQTYAEDFLDSFIPDQSVYLIHALFSDPWPKRRHQKRRLFQPSVWPRLFRVLTSTGRIQIATDYEEYYLYIYKQLQALSRNNISFEETSSGPFVSNFQAKYEKEGRKIHFFTVSQGKGVGRT